MFLQPFKETQNFTIIIKLSLGGSKKKPFLFQTARRIRNLKNSHVRIFITSRARQTRKSANIARSIKTFGIVTSAFPPRGYIATW